MADWTKIQIEYEQGVKPKELAEKYGLTSKQIRDKASRNNWKQTKEEIEKTKLVNSRQKYDKEINELTGLALNVLREIANNPEAKDTDRINAAKGILDVSGLKKESHDINLDNSPVEVKFI